MATCELMVILCLVWHRIIPVIALLNLQQKINLQHTHICSHWFRVQHYNVNKNKFTFCWRWHKYRGCKRWMTWQRVARWLPWRQGLFWGHRRMPTDTPWSKETMPWGTSWSSQRTSAVHVRHVLYKTSTDWHISPSSYNVSPVKRIQTEGLGHRNDGVWFIPLSRPFGLTSRCWHYPSGWCFCICSWWQTRCSSSKTWWTEAPQSWWQSLPWCKKWRIWKEIVHLLSISIYVCFSGLTKSQDKQ